MQVLLLLMSIVVLVGAWALVIRPKAEIRTPNIQNEVKIYSKEVNGDPARNLTLLKTISIDVEGDNQPENIELYTAAQKDTSGAIMWDDGQNWLLIVRDGNKEYPLFDDRIQLGQLDYLVYASSAKKTHIIVTYSDTTSMKVSDYSFDRDQMCFMQKVVYNPSDINWIMPYEPYK